MKTEEPGVSFDYHPLANIFPLMNDEDLSVLALSIQESGQREPVILYEQKILDGRNRYRALQALNLPIHTQNFEGDDPVQFVADHNLHRRHLKASQKAAVAALLSDYPRGRPRVRRDLDTEEQSESDSLVDMDPPLTQEDAANMFGVSKRLVAAGAKVRKQGHPNLIEMVKDGAISIESAVMVSDLPMADQEEVLSNSEEAFKKAIRGIRENSKNSGTKSKSKVANQTAANSPGVSMAGMAMLVPVPFSDSSTTAQQPVGTTPSLAEFFESLVRVGELVGTSGFDAEEWFIRHSEQLPDSFLSSHMRAVMSGLGVVEQIIDHVQKNETQ